MPLFNWSPSYSVGVVELDKQHKSLIDLINKLHEAMQTGQGAREVGNVITELINYTRFHFTAEEKYFAAFKYPETAAHKAAHEAFIQKVTEFQT